MPNRLIHEQSPYLLQHANNPVDWYAWGDEPFDRAARENKPVLVSIGYAACHWCHVMEHESFENDAVAAFMNEHFINIKVDREELPHIDHMYMDAVQAISGSGGWPLNVFVTPQRVPFYGGTYYPPHAAYNRPSWIQILARMNEIWHQQQDEVKAQADQMVAYLKNAAKFATGDTGMLPDAAMCRKIADNLLAQADTQYGGFGHAPKFPATMAITFLLEHYYFTGYQPALHHALASLDAMISGGIYDQVGGGFSRYATDSKWLVPHFEKMLYDNALLVMALCDAYSITRNEQYKQVIEETIAFAERDLKGFSRGGYYSSLDADSEGVEGKCYTWTWEEWLQAFNGNNDSVTGHYFGVSKEGNWEGVNILHRSKSIGAIAENTGKPIMEIEEQIKNAKRQLFEVRNRRIRPATDDKCLLSWNALMNIALSKAAMCLQNESYVQLADSHMQWMLSHFYKDGALMHTWKNDIAKITANLDDIASLIQALIQLGAAAGQNNYIIKAEMIMEHALEYFSDEESSLFYYTSLSQTDIPVRKIDVHDGALPAANALMAHNLLLLGQCLERSGWIVRGDYMLGQMAGNAVRYPYSFAYWASLIQRQVYGNKVAICTGSGAVVNARQLQQRFLPQLLVLTSQKEISELPVFEGKFISGQSFIFVCTQQACLSPVSNIEEALHQLNH